MSARVAAGGQADILASLRRLKGTVTVGDVVADSGLSADAVRNGLKALLESHHGHLSVTDSGELVYDFDAGMIERGTEPFLARMWSACRRVTQGAFKAWIVVMLVVYFVVMVALIIAALFASRRGNSGRGGFGGGRGGGSFGFNWSSWYWIWGPRWRIGRPYYGHRWERTLPKEDRVPFYKKVFAFVFGPDQPRPTQKQLDRSKLRLIRARSGVLTTAELVEHTGSTFPEAEDEVGRLLGAYDGEAAVSPDGELVYAFPGLMASTGTSSPRPPNPAWMRLEPDLELTGNSAGANAVVAGMNTFTLIASATAPWFIFPRLGIGGAAAFWALVIVPVVFSVLFFAGPLVRMIGVGFENRKRHRRNLRRVLTGFVYDRALRGRPVALSEAHAHIRSKLPSVTPSRNEVASLLDEFVAALDGDVSVADDGDAYYRFTAIREQYAAADTVRRVLELEKRQLGDVVFSTSDSVEDADRRELDLFDKELVGPATRLEGYLPAVDRVDVEEPYELIAFDEEMYRRR